MRIGIVKVNSNTYVEEALQKLGHTFLTLQINDDDLVRKIKSSEIQKWIFTGTGLAVSVLNPLSPSVPLDILKMTNKDFFCICYSMESVLHQLGYPLKERNVQRKERFDLGSLRVYRNHRYYFSVKDIDSKITILQSYRGELMTACYKNVFMTQWHPERTKDGLELLKVWIET